LPTKTRLVLIAAKSLSWDKVTSRSVPKAPPERMNWPKQRLPNILCIWKRFRLISYNFCRYSLNWL
jgi:hypothetical protein